jgi:peroxiredoxin
MANVNNAERAAKFIREASDRKKNANRRESLYIDALAAYYDDWAQVKEADAEQKKRDEAEKASGVAPQGADEAARVAASQAGNATSESKKAEPPAERSDDNNKPAAKDETKKEDDPKKAAEKQRKKDYLKRLEAIVNEFSDDIEAKAFLAYQHWNWRETLPIENYDAVDALLDQVLAAEPMHPAHHYRIHLWDDKSPERALASAARCGQAAPAVGHMWHMPGHTYSKLHRHADAAWQQEAAARVDHAYMIRDRVMPYQIHNYAHNNEWLVRSLLNAGRVRDAVDVAKNLIETPRHPKLNSPTDDGSAASHGRQRLFDALVTFELWNDYIALSDTAYLAPGDSEAGQVKHIRWLGAAHLAAGNLIQGSEQLSLLEKRFADLTAQEDDAAATAEQRAREENKPDAEIEKAKTDARKTFDKRRESLEKALNHLRGLQAAAAGAPAAAVDLLEKAGDIRKPHLALAHLRAGDKEKAEKLAREAVDDGKNQVYPLAVYVEVLHGLGKHDQAKEQFEKLRMLAGVSDLKAPIFDRITDVAASLGYTTQWRLPHKAATDVGVRPPLSSLGPFRWQPMPAVEWVLPNADGQAVAMRQYSGKPLVMIFYLGQSCVHCAEQLNAFAATYEDYRRAGIEVVAISSDAVAELKEKGTPRDGVNAGGGIPFTLLSNADLRAFKAYRCYDDFEDRPLHGTFLIDKDGLVRWQDIGPEPFKDAAFLLKEAKRLAALPK